MKKQLLFLMAIAITMPALAQNQIAGYVAYIEQYKKTALEQQQLYKIPASITMAQGILESGAGQSLLAKEANNHFGIKCTPDWTGETYLHDDDKKDDCFRKYKKAEESWLDHSAFLQRKRYAPLFELPITDYKAWANGLKQCGYATDPRYPEKLIKLIEDYHLDALTADVPANYQPVSAPDTIYASDTMDIAEKEELKEVAKMAEVVLFHNHKSGWRNGSRYIIAEEGESFETLAYFLNIKEKTLRKYNDASDGRGLKAGDRVYIYAKHKRADRKHKTYYVRKGDTAWSIAQKFGMQMKSIYELNGIKEGTPLVTRQELVLR